MIACTYETKFLGIIIQANLKWNTHNVQLKNKISKSIGTIIKAKSLLTTAHLKMLYLSLIEPYLTYCCIVWASPEKTTFLDVLYKLQKRAARIIMFVHHLAHVEPLFRKLNKINIYDLCKCLLKNDLCCSWYNKFYDDDDAPLTLTFAP